jgi:histone-binding protein RBBP4
MAEEGRGKASARADAAQVLKDNQVWRMSTPFLYEVVASHTLRWPSLSVQWLPSTHNTASNGYTVKHLLVGANSSDEAEAYAMKIIEVTLPPKFNYEEASKNFGTPITGTCVKMRIVKTFECMNEIHRIRCMPQLPSVVALKTAAPEVEIYANVKLTDNDGDVNMNDGRSHEKIKSEDFQPKILKGHTENGWGLSWSPLDQGKLVSGSGDRAICVWDAQAALDGQSSTSKPLLKIDESHTDSVCDVAWNYFERDIFASVADDTRLNLWDTRARNHKIGSSENGHEDQINSCSWSPHHSSLIATASVDKTVMIWDTRNLKNPMHKLNGHRAALNFVTWSPTHPGLLASCGLDRRVFVWDLTRTSRFHDAEAVSELLFVHGGHVDSVSELQWCPDQDWLIASVDEDNVCQVWEMAHVIHEEGSEDIGPKFFKKDLIS